MRLALWVTGLAVVAGCGGGKSTSSDVAPTSGTPGGTISGTAAGTPTGSTPTGTATGTSPQRWIDIGNAALDHVDGTPGMPVVMNHGPQEGWHIDVSGLVHGLGAVVGVNVSATRIDDGVVVASSDIDTFLQLAEYDGGAQVGWFAGQRAYVLRDQPTVTLDDICQLDGVALELCAEAEDLGAPGTLASGCLEVVAALDPIDVAPCVGSTP